jgi:hypothetical protein
MTGLRQFGYIGALVGLTLSLDDMDFPRSGGSSGWSPRSDIAEEDRRDADGNQGAVAAGARRAQTRPPRASLFRRGDVPALP